MSTRLDIFLMTLMALLVLMLVEIAAGAYVHQLKRCSTTDVHRAVTDSSAVSKQIDLTIAR